MILIRVPFFQLAFSGFCPTLTYSSTPRVCPKSSLTSPFSLSVSHPSDPVALLDPDNPAVDARALNALPSHHARDDVTETNIIAITDICGLVAGVSHNDEGKVCLAMLPDALRLHSGTITSATGWRAGIGYLEGCCHQSRPKGYRSEPGLPPSYPPTRCPRPKKSTNLTLRAAFQVHEMQNYLCLTGRKAV